jgi:hypothetical protein
VVVGAQCPGWVHDRYRAAGPDGRSYATWHAASDPQYRCWFGHEHGDDPSGAPALRGRAVLFGYAAAQAGMSEPHEGFKVYRWDRISAPGHNHNGAALLMTLHQGTSGAARFTVVHHGISVDYIHPTDGREVHVRLLAPFGALAVGCGANDPNMALRLQQGGEPGMRQVPADRCFNLPRIPYEDWITALYVGTDAQGRWAAYLDPHFAVFDPNTYCLVQNQACTLAHSDVRARTGADPLGPGAWFKGTKREFYLNSVWLDNPSGSSSIWTDAYGRKVAAGSPGAIEQYVAQMRARPLGSSLVSGATHQYDDGTVRAPN